MFLRFYWNSLSLQMPVSCEIKIANRNITFSSTVETEKAHFFFFDRKRNGMTFLTESFSGFEGTFGLLSWKGERKVVLCFCWLSLAISSTSILHGSQTELLSFSECNPFFFLFLWVDWGCVGGVFMLGGYRNVNKILTVTFLSFLVDREN